MIHVLIGGRRRHWGIFLHAGRLAAVSAFGKVASIRPSPANALAFLRTIHRFLPGRLVWAALRRASSAARASARCFSFSLLSWRVRRSWPVSASWRRSMAPFGPQPQAHLLAQQAAVGRGDQWRIAFPSQPKSCSGGSRYRASGSKTKYSFTPRRSYSRAWRRGPLARSSRK